MGHAAGLHTWPFSWRLQALDIRHFYIATVVRALSLKSFANEKKLVRSHETCKGFFSMTTFFSITMLYDLTRFSILYFQMYKNLKTTLPEGTPESLKAGKNLDGEKENIFR